MMFFFKTGYTERFLEVTHCQKYYGTSAEWKKYIDAQKTQMKVEEPSSNYQPLRLPIQRVPSGDGQHRARLLRKYGAKTRHRPYYHSLNL